MRAAILLLVKMPKSVPVSLQASGLVQCREYVEANHIDQQLLKFLPEGGAIKAEADAIRRRM